MNPISNPLGHTALHRAVRDGSIKSTLAILANGSIDIDQGVLHGSTPLMVAALWGHSHIMKILLKKGASVSMVDDEGLTALHCCAEEGHSEVVRALVKAGANPDNRMPDGVTPLYIAAERGQLNLIRELLRGNADPSLNRVHMEGYTSVPLDIAAQRGHSDVVRELVDELGIDGCDATHAGKRALCLASKYQHLGVMAILTEAGVVDDGSVLAQAAKNGREASVKFLLRQRYKE
ncbi:unnamed protein product, partial [Ectocarpus fasciculatus]